MSKAATEERKQLEQRIAALWIEHDSKREAIFGIESQLSEIEKQAQKLQRRLDELKPRAIKVSDHAVLRYLERKAGIDVEAIRKSILDSELPSMVATLGGSGKFPVNGYQVVLKDYTVVTIN
jgi:hemerythrin-like domain-containing protein